MGRIKKQDRFDGLCSIHTNSNVRGRLARAGYTTPFHIARTSKKNFVADAVARMNIQEETAVEIYEKAGYIKQKVMHLYTNIRTTAGSPYYRSLRSHTLGANVEEEFENWPSYQELFGSLDYTSGESWSSIFGLTAYFVDLMRVVSEYITAPNVKSIPEGMKFNERRPDLQDIQLNQSNTENEIGYLQIINERLLALAKKVLGTDEVYAQMAGMEYPLGFPVNLALEQIRLILQKNGSSLEQVYAVASSDRKAAMLEHLQVKKECLAMLTKQWTEEAVAKCYGIAVGQITSLYSIGTYMKAVNCTRTDLTKLLLQDLTQKEEKVAAVFYINSKLGKETYITIKDNQLINCNSDALGRMNKFLRLQRMFGLDSMQLDYLIQNISITGEIDDAFVEKAVEALNLYKQFDMEYLDFVGLFGEMKTYGASNQYAKIYNRGSKKYNPKGAKNPNYADKIISWDRGEQNQTDEMVNTGSWLVSSLGISMEQLSILADWLYDDKKIMLTIENLSILYAHRLLEKAFSMDMKQYVLLLQLCKVKGALSVTDVAKLSKMAKQLSEYGLSVYDADYFTNNHESSYVKVRYTESDSNALLKHIWNTMRSGTEDKEQEESENKKIVTEALATLLQTNADTIQAISIFFAKTPIGSKWFHAFLIKPERPEEKPPYWDYICNVILTANKWLNVLENKIPIELLTSIGENGEIYGFTDFSAMTTQNLIEIYQFASYVTYFSDTTYTLLACIQLDKIGIQKLSTVTGWKEKDIVACLAFIKGSITEKLQQMIAYFNCMNHLKVSAEFLQRLVAIKDMSIAEYSKLNKLVHELENSLTIGLSTADKDAIQLQYREYLVQILTWKKDMDSSRLYKYLLMDVEMDEKMMVTYIREGVNALQLYLQRCHMGLEPGIKNLEIDDAWWEWLMDYNMWKANRQIYVYPENYLLPSIRHTKTDSFVEVESGLQQSQLSKDYVESLYAQYIDSFCNKVEVHVVSAYEADKALYLFGRTKQQPYQYYYCKKDKTGIWSQWLDLKECKINASTVTPVYAFGKLYLFWVELTKLSNSNIQGEQSVECITYTAKVQYTFLNSQNQWVSPQDMVSDEMVYYSENSVNPVEAHPLFRGIFQMDDPMWSKVCVIPITGKNYSPFMNKSKSNQRLVVLYGPFLNSVCTNVEDSIANTMHGSNGEAFIARLNGQARKHNIMIQEQYNGHIAAGFTKILNTNMEEDTLVRNNEFFLLEEYAYMNGATAVTPQWNQMEKCFGAVITNNALLTMLEKKQIQLQSQTPMIDALVFVMDGISVETSQKIFSKLNEIGVIGSPSIYEPICVLKEKLLKTNLKKLLLEETNLIDGKPQLVQEVERVLCNYTKSTILLPTGLSENARIIPVYNTSNSFILDDVEETFLFTRERDVKLGDTKNMNELITVAFPFIDACVLQGIGIAKSTAISMISKLVTDGIVSEKHVVIMEKCTLDAVQKSIAEYKVSDAMCKTIYAVLHNDPYVYKDVFVDRILGIDKELSKQIYQTFVDEEIIVNNRVLLSSLYEMTPAEVLSEYIRVGKLGNKQVQEVYDKLLYAPIPLSLKMWTEDTLRADKGTYRITRLSNGASLDLKRHIFADGVDGVLDIDNQRLPAVSIKPLSRYGITSEQPVILPKASDGAAVDFEGLYGEYYWEVFYHIPSLVADILKANSQNEFSKAWLEYIFNPANKEETIKNSTFYEEAGDYINMEQSINIYTALLNHGVIDKNGRVVKDYNRKMEYLLSYIPQSSISIVCNILDNHIVIPHNSFYYNFYPFRQHELESMLESLSDKNPAIAIYNNDPYDPHSVARIRIGAYEKYTVMQYIDNLIQWGDKNFMQNSWEALTKASLLYLLADELLGKRPECIGNAKEKKTLTFRLIQQRYPVIPQFLIDLLQLVNCDMQENYQTATQIPYLDDTMYFGIPENDELLKYWDIMEDRLYKLRNSLDINGYPRTIQLYGTDINPLDIAKQTANAGSFPGNMNAAVNNRYPYRFTFLIEQAKMLANQLASTGSQMLSALEKKDAETFMYMTNTNEKVLLDLTTVVKENQIAEMKETVEGLHTSLVSAQKRQEYYSDLVVKGLSDGEKESLTASDLAFTLSTTAGIIKLAAGTAHAIPQVGSPFAMTYGGDQIGAVMDSVAGGMELGASIANFIGQRALTMSGYKRREEDWGQQRDNAYYDGESLKHQMIAAESRIASAEADLAAHKKQIEQKAQILSYLSSKFTSSQLYQWVIGRLGTVMWQTYQLALELALQAQEAYRYEKDSTENFFTYQYWDSLKKGLLSGESLMLSLNQLQNAYMKKNTRSFEIEKHISLALNCPEAFLNLKSTGSCNFDLSESMFDYDYPGMYARKIVAVSLSVPAVVGPYQTLKAILTQTKNEIVTKPEFGAVQYVLSNHTTQPYDSVRVNQMVNQKIAISKGIEDSGLFNLNFSDERYLPFEGTGAVSSWTLDMPKDTNRFNYESISDVIIHVKYSAKMDMTLGEKVRTELSKYKQSGSLYYNLRQNFYGDWKAFIEDHSNAEYQTLKVVLKPEASYVGKAVAKAAYLRFVYSKPIDGKATYQSYDLTVPTVEQKELVTKKDISAVVLEQPLQSVQGEWQIKVDLKAIQRDKNLQFLLKDGYLDETKFQNVELLLLYEGTFYEG